MTDTIVEPMELAAQIVSAHVSNNTIEAGTLPDLIQQVYRVFADLKGGISEPALVEKLVPAVPIRKSVYPDYIVCLEDGMKLKLLKRHLHTAFGMTPDQYRKRWRLPSNYPMTAPTYAKHRSGLAKNIGLGRKVTTLDWSSQDDRPKAAE